MAEARTGIRRRPRRAHRSRGRRPRAPACRRSRGAPAARDDRGARTRPLPRGAARAAARSGSTRAGRRRRATRRRRRAPPRGRPPGRRLDPRVSTGYSVRVGPCAIRAVGSLPWSTPRSRVAPVPATLMDGKALAARIRRGGRATRSRSSVTSGLATVLVGDDPASDVYIRLKHRARRLEAGIDARDVRLPAETSARRTSSRSSPSSTPTTRSTGSSCSCRSRRTSTRRGSRTPSRRAKDVDGFHPVNAGNLYLGTPLHVPATPAGCMALLAEYGVDPAGKEAVVIGRSEIVGRPVAMLLLQAHATVTICHSRTADLAAEVRRADIVVAAVGVPGIVTPEMVKPGATVHRRRAHAHRGGDSRRRRPRRRRGRRAPDADARRHRPDDDRDAPPQRRQGRALPARRPCVPDLLTLRFSAFAHLAPASPALRVRRTFVVGRDGHREVVLEREGFRLHRARERR